MDRAIRVAATDRVKFLNIGLMLISCVVALYIPFVGWVLRHIE
jgi:hypothetical protein